MTGRDGLKYDEEREGCKGDVVDLEQGNICFR